MVRRKTIAASFALLWLLPASSARAAQSAPSSASSSASSQPKAATHKHKHSAKHQPPGQKTPTPERISEIQSALAREGYYQGDPTGKFDSSTLAALEKFQSANGLDSNGKLDASTLQKLGLGSDIAGVGAPKQVVPGCCSAKPAGSAPATPATSTPNPPTQPSSTSSNATPTVSSSDTKADPK